MRHWPRPTLRFELKSFPNVWQATVIEGNATEIGALCDSYEASQATQGRRVLSVTEPTHLPVNEGPRAGLIGTVSAHATPGRRQHDVMSRNLTVTPPGVITCQWYHGHQFDQHPEGCYVRARHALLKSGLELHTLLLLAMRLGLQMHTRMCSHPIPRRCRSVTGIPHSRRIAP